MRKPFQSELTVLGSFELTQPTIRVSDPCYDRDVWCCGTIEKCMVGTWEAGVLYSDEGPWGKRVSIIAIRHKETGPAFSSVNNRAICSMNEYRGWSHQLFEVGVDSGQAGFFDDQFYRDDAVFAGYPDPEHDFDEVWYSHICDITLSEANAGVIPHGAVSSSGYGDGGYDCYAHRNKNGDIDFAFIVFI